MLSIPLEEKDGSLGLAPMEWQITRRYLHFVTTENLVKHFHFPFLPKFLQTNHGEINSMGEQ